MTTLKDVSISKETKIKEIKDELITAQLASFGFHIGSTLNVVSKLPFNGAITCEGNNTRIALRAEDAANIVVMD